MEEILIGKEREGIEERSLSGGEKDYAWKKLTQLYSEGKPVLE